MSIAKLRQLAAVSRMVVTNGARRDGRPVRRFRCPGLGLLWTALAAIATPAQAIDFVLPGQIDGQLNTTLTAGAAWRMQHRSSDLVGKANLNPDVCGRDESGRVLYQSCQGLFRDQTFIAEHLSGEPGQFTMNADDGNLNYDRHDLIQAPIKLTQDLALTAGDYGLFARWLYFYDLVNNDFTEVHPNRITRDNYLQVGNISHIGDELLPLPIPTVGVRTDSRPCPANRNPLGTPCGIVYGPGGVVKQRRTDGETLRQIGADLQLLDFYFFGQAPLGDERKLSFKIGRQNVNWGESTMLVFDSINTVNPVNANNVFRVGSQVEEFFQPVGMLFASFDPFEGATIEAFYQYEWLPLEIPPPGSYFSFLDLGVNNSGSHFNLSFGGSAEDPDRLGILGDNTLSGVTNSSATGLRLPDNEPSGGDQYGIALKYYAEWLNQGTELGFYYTRTHSRVPIASFYAMTESCHKRTNDTLSALLACSDIPLLHGLIRPHDPEGIQDGDDGGVNRGSMLNADSIRLQLEYPRGIDMFGVSFNTVFGELSLQGEVAYRPRAPLQVDIEDLVFAAFGPTLTNCHLPQTGCQGSGQLAGIATGLLDQLGLGALQDPLNGLLGSLDALGGLGVYQDPSACSLVIDNRVCIYPGSDFVIDANGTPGAFDDTYDLFAANMPGSGRSFPSFVVPYRGGTVGTNPGSDHTQPYNAANRGYLRGWEAFEAFQFNLGGTVIRGATENPIGADQVLMVFELGATWIPGLPDLDELQLEAPGTFLHASAGADGSGADRSQQACSTNLACSYGPDALRFNPQQQDLDGFPDELSWGYVVISQIRYESVLPGISLQPQIIWKHDVGGTSPGFAGNFVEGRKNMALAIETRYHSSLSLTLGYTWFFGGGVYNLLADRDFAQAFLKFQF